MAKRTLFVLTQLREVGRLRTLGAAGPGAAFPRRRPSSRCPEACLETVVPDVSFASDPLATLDDDYELAVIHLACDMDRDTKAITLLCGVVELLPKEVPPPDATPWKSPPAAGSRRPFVRRIVVNARRAVDWYRDCVAGRGLLPTNDGHLPDRDAEAVETFVSAPLAEEPTWPALVCSDRLLPGVTGRMVTPRAHHLLATGFDPGSHWHTAKERGATESFLREEYEFDFESHPEFLGSLHLLAPNPVFREVDIRSTSDPGLRSFIVRVQPRAGRSLQGLRLILRAKRPTGLADFSEVDLTSPLTILRFGSSVQTLGGYVIDAQRGLLYHQPDDGFYGFRISTQLDVVHPEIVDVPPTPSRPQGERYEVSRRGAHGVASTIGAKRRISEALSLFHSAMSDRIRKQRARDDQRWFRERIDDAARAIRDVVRKARRRVWIVDPYFGATEFHRFARAVEAQNAEIRVLTSARYLDTRQGVKSDSAELAGHILAAAIPSTGVPTRGARPVVRSMRGKDPAIHDRFLVVDDDLWMLGSSLNEFGARGSMMLKVPAPEEVICDLDSVWLESEPLEEWITRHPIGGSDA